MMAPKCLKSNRWECARHTDPNLVDFFLFLSSLATQELWLHSWWLPLLRRTENDEGFDRSLALSLLCPAFHSLLSFPLFFSMAPTHTPGNRPLLSRISRRPPLLLPNDLSFLFSILSLSLLLQPTRKGQLLRQRGATTTAAHVLPALGFFYRPSFFL